MRQNYPVTQLMAFWTGHRCEMTSGKNAKEDSMGNIQNFIQ